MKNVLVLFGGASSEHDVSTVSASSVLKQIPQEKYSIYMMGITKEGQWYLYEGDVDALPEDGWLTSGTCTPAFVSPDRGIHGITVLRENGYENIRIDIAFPVLHGKNGEDGTIQGLFQMAGIPFVGCDMASSAVSMDKVFTNTVADANGVPQAAWDSITAYEYRTGAKTLDEVADKLGYPIFVKPANAGSSVGITKAHDRAELEGAMELALRHDTRILFEEFIDGYEVECAVLGNDELETGVVGQILPAKSSTTTTPSTRTPRASCASPRRSPRRSAPKWPRPQSTSSRPSAAPVSPGSTSLSRRRPAASCSTRSTPFRASPASPCTRR